MKGDVLSRRYAEALADVAEREGLLRRCATELEALAGGLSESAAFRALVQTAGKSRREKRQMFRRVSDSLNVCGPTRRLLAYLVEKKRTGLLPLLAESFAREADRRLGVRRATLASAAPLSEQARERIVARLEAICGARVEVDETVDESLIAGFQVRLDGRFFDGSLRGRLERFRERIAHG
ncbi:MAG: ATP synthase F1 subunit delta [Planctomycetota bacterium]|jgi:F-type H+-transporting ATPase subunit delta